MGIEGGVDWLSILIMMGSGVGVIGHLGSITRELEAEMLHH